MKRVFPTSLLLVGVLMSPVAAQENSGEKAGAKPSSQAAKPGAQAQLATMTRESCVMTSLCTSRIWST